ncbi:MAG: hypothetical protein ACK5LC_07790 [Coprobacillaceae bacterium]
MEKHIEIKIDDIDYIAVPKEEYKMRELEKKADNMKYGRVNGRPARDLLKDLEKILDV